MTINGMEKYKTTVIEQKVTDSWSEVDKKNYYPYDANK